MVKFVPISASRHTGKAWQRPTGFAIASTQAIVPLVVAELARAAVSMPIAFVEQVGQHVPVAVMSPLAGRNLFVGPAGQWLGTYVPAAFRGYPFRLGRVESEEQVTLCIDEDSGLVVETDGVAEEFIGAEGNLSPNTKAMFDFQVEMERSRAITEIAVAALTDAGLIQPWQFQVMLDERPTPATGLFRVDEGALNALADTAFLKLRRAGGLVLGYLQLLSMNQIAVFDQLNLLQQQLAQAHQQQQITSLDELFAQASSGTLRFN